MTELTDNIEEENKNPQEPKLRIYEATEKDWEDFFAVQEDFDCLFDR